MELLHKILSSNFLESSIRCDKVAVEFKIFNLSSLAKHIYSSHLINSTWFLQLCTCQMAVGLIRTKVNEISNTKLALGFRHKEAIQSALRTAFLCLACACY